MHDLSITGDDFLAVMAAEAFVRARQSYAHVDIVLSGRGGAGGVGGQPAVGAARTVVIPGRTVIRCQLGGTSAERRAHGEVLARALRASRK